MNLVQCSGLAFVFMAAADIAMAGGLGMIGVHGAVVDGGAAMGEALGVPQLDWFDLWENGEISFLEAETDPCLSSGGHYHGNTCHVPGVSEPADIVSEKLAPPLPEAPLSFES